MSKDVLAALSAARAKYKNQLNAINEDTIVALCKEFFVEHPEVKCIAWTQHTPSFNDGDPCRFGVGEPILVLDPSLVAYSKAEWCQTPDHRKRFDEHMAELILPDTEEEYHDVSVGEIESEYGVPCYGELPTAVDNDFSELWSSLGDDLLEAVFGDGAQVIITPSKITVKEYYSN